MPPEKAFENFSPCGKFRFVMLDDRSYMRNLSFSSRWSATIALLVVNVAVFIGSEINRVYFGKHLETYFYLSLLGIKHGYLWQFITFQFFHGGWLHLFLNLWALYVFGQPLEEELGKPAFLRLYFASGVIGGLLQILAAYLKPLHFDGPVIGASAGIFGLIAAFASLYPERQLSILLAFIIPVTLRAKFLLLILGLFAVVGIVLPSGGGIAHAAHLGGLLTGMAYVRWLVQNGEGGLAWRPLHPIVRARELVNVSGFKSPAWKRPKGRGEDETPSAEFISREVDPILDKISAQGIQSLTARERQILEAARNKMGKR